MAVYIPTIMIVIVFSAIVDYARKNNGNFILTRKKITSIYFGMLTAVSLILVAGLRWQVGTDYGSYARNYSTYVQELWASLINFNEPGIKIISMISSIVYNDYSTMFFISSLITIGLSVWTIYKYSDYFSLSIILYIFIGSWHGSFNGVRQYLACAVLFAGHRYIIERKLWKYLLIVFLASTFHVSALAMISLYYVPIRQLGKKDFIFLTALIVLGLTIYNPIIEIASNILVANGRNPILMDSTYVNQQVSILRVLVMIAPIILYLVTTYNKGLNKEDYFYINMLFINATIYMMTMNSAYLARFTIYTNIYVVLGFPKMFKRVDKKLSILILFIALILYALFWGYEIRITPNLRNFQWIFER